MSGSELTAHWDADLGQWILTRPDGSTFPFDPIVIADHAFEISMARINQRRIRAAIGRITFYAGLLAVKGIQVSIAEAQVSEEEASRARALHLLKAGH